MDDLRDYISAHTDIVRDAPAAKCADLCFFKVVLCGSPSADVLVDLVQTHSRGPRPVYVLDSCEHNYLELGAWLGSQELALRLMGMGSLLGVWKLLTPLTVLGENAPPALVDQLAGAGMLTIVAPRRRRS